MKYRTAGLLTLGLTAVATLTFYNTASTRAQPPLGSAISNSDNHNHDHDHDGHNHSHDNAGESPAPNADTITAPSGGPPPLPTTRPAQSPNQSGALQQGQPSPPAADFPPTLLPPSTAPGYTFQPGSYDCPNASRYDSHSHRDACPLNSNNQRSSFESHDHQFVMPLTELTHHSQPSSCQYGTSREFGVHEYRPSFDSPEPCYQRFSHNPYGHGPTYHGH